MPQALVTAPREFSIRPRMDVWQQLRKQTSLDSDIDLAGRMSLDRVTVYRTLTGMREPSKTFIAHALAAFPFTTFDRLFEWYAK